MSYSKNMIFYKTEAELAIMKTNSSLVSEMLSEVAKILKPGITTMQIDELCKTFIADHKGIPSFYNYNGYPYNICASVNDVVVHGFPDTNPLKEGDIVTIDLGITRDGFVGEHAYTFILGEVSDEVLQLVRVTKES